MQFQSTRPVRGATYLNKLDHLVKEFQSTRPVRGATSVRHCGMMTGSGFQSTRPVRGATFIAQVLSFFV